VRPRREGMEVSVGEWTEIMEAIVLVTDHSSYDNLDCGL
jgi:hypothetical protein